MLEMPKTSITLLKALALDARSVRWAEFYASYEEPMRGFLASRFPLLEPEDVIQETMAALVECLPRYRYMPDEKGHFRNYLMGVLKHKAMDSLRVQKRAAAANAALAESSPANDAAAYDAEEDEWRSSALEVAIAQMMADDTLNAMHRTVFREVALVHRPPSEVASELGISRGNVDVIKSRMLERLAELVARLTGEA